MAVRYVYPNVFRGRGKFSERCERAQETGCSFVEIPAHFIRGKREIQKTGQEIYTIPGKDAVRTLYGDPSVPERELPYILHTEPIITRRMAESRGKKPVLQWQDPSWRQELIAMLCAIAETLGSPAAKIEIHPGERKEVTLENILEGATDILDRYSAVTGSEPDILLENRTGQRVRDGTDIADLYWLCEEKFPGLSGKFGIILDVSQLFTVTQDDFLPSFAQIPDSCLKGFHIHTQHKSPDETDLIPWKNVFERIGKLPQDLIINPEIHHGKYVVKTIQFCQDRLP